MFLFVQNLLDNSLAIFSLAIHLSMLGIVWGLIIDLYFYYVS